MEHEEEPMSKGDKQRPTDQQKYRDNWEQIFGKKEQLKLAEEAQYYSSELLKKVLIANKRIRNEPTKS